MHGPMLLLVMSSFFAAGLRRAAIEDNGIPAWVWPVLVLMIGFLVWWWLRKPAGEVSSHILTDRPDNNSQSPVLPLLAEAPSVLSRSGSITHKVSHGPTPQPVTAEASVPPEPEEDRDQNLPAVAPIIVKPDDLTIVEGIGPKINQVLHSAGIQSLFQLSESEVAALKEILTTAGLKLVDPTTWPQQARLAIAGDLENLKALQATLRGGRRV